MRSYFSVPRRYNFPVPLYEAGNLPNKSQHLNDIIKKLILMTLSAIPIPDDYRVAGNIFYTVAGDAVADTILNINSGRATILGNILIIDYTGDYLVLGNTLYTTNQDNVSDTT